MNNKMNIIQPSGVMLELMYLNHKNKDLRLEVISDIIDYIKPKNVLVILDKEDQIVWGVIRGLLRDKILSGNNDDVSIEVVSNFREYSTFMLDALSDANNIKFKFHWADPFVHDVRDMGYDMIIIDTIKSYHHISKCLKMYTKNCKDIIVLGCDLEPYILSSNLDINVEALNVGCTPSTLKLNLYAAIEDFIYNTINIDENKVGTFQYKILKHYKDNGDLVHIQMIIN